VVLIEIAVRGKQAEACLMHADSPDQGMANNRRGGGEESPRSLEARLR
jgi:hypothetical protein